MPINWATKNFIAFQVLQPVSVVRKCFKDLERPKPEVIKFTLFALFLSGCIPFEHQITLLKLFLLVFPVKSLFDLLLVIVSSVQDLFSDLLHLHHLMNSSKHMVRFPLIVLEEICHRQGNLSGEDDLNPINKLEGRETQGFLCCYSIGPKCKLEL
jgi:hypothetical protein